MNSHTGLKYLAMLYLKFQTPFLKMINLDRFLQKWDEDGQYEPLNEKIQQLEIIKNMHNENQNLV